MADGSKLKMVPEENWDTESVEIEKMSNDEYEKAKTDLIFP